MSASPPPPSNVPPPPTSGYEPTSGIRRRPVPVNYNWHVEDSGGDSEYEGQEGDEVVFEDEQPSKFREYVGIFFDYVFWILLAYCASNFLLWLGERLGLISPQYEEWNPARWWHRDPHSLQKELFQNATAGASTAVQFEGLKKWIEAGPGGWVSPKLLVSDFLSERGRYERRLEVKETVDKDEILVKLPLSHVLSADFCQQDLTDNTIRQVVDAQKKSSPTVELSAWTWITLFMIAHSNKELASTSTISSVFDFVLRSEYVDAALSYMPIFWNDDNLHWLNGTDLLNIHVLDVHAAIETEYQKLVYLVPSIETGIPVIDFKKWAMVVMSRGETVDLPDRENNTRTVPQLAIMPLIDLVDHHLPIPDRLLTAEDDLHKFQENGSHTNISYSQDMAVVVLRAREVLESRSAVTVGYGVRPNADYLLYHGFTMPREWTDRTVCMLYSMIELPLPADMPSWKTRFLSQPYRFAVPACPSRKSTPHVIMGTARFLAVTEAEVVQYEEQLAKEPGLLAGLVSQRDEKFLHHGPREAVSIVCNTTSQPPICRWPISLASERAAWASILKQTLARVAQHVTPVEEDERLLDEDDKKETLTVNQRHSVIARREEKLTLQRWCSVAVRMSKFLDSPEAASEWELVKVPDSEILENEEPRLRPKYWARLLERSEEAVRMGLPSAIDITGDKVPDECRAKR